MIRFFDVFLSSIGLIGLMPVMLALTVICYFDTGSPIFPQLRVGRFKKKFLIYKFRTMRLDAPMMPTHKIDKDYVTHVGVFLRRTKLDELPQLWNVLIGDMSLVGPRPCLETQYRLIELREHVNLFDIKPGITGEAQLGGVDMSDAEKLVEVELGMKDKWAMSTYAACLINTVFGLLGYRHDRL